MKRLATTLFCIAIAVLIAAPAVAQESGDFRTNGSGDWSDPQIWQTYDGSSWTATANPPSGSETIWVDSTDGTPDSVFVDVAVAISGTLVNQGIVENDDVDSLLTIANGGTYQHDRDYGELPTMVWDEGSTALFTGVTGLTGDAPENRRQNYWHLIFDTPDLTNNLNMDLDSVTIGGDITVRSSGIGRWYLTSTDPLTDAVVTIMGDVIVEDGAFGVQGTSNPYTQFVVHHYGNVNVTGGNFSVSRGSQPGGSTMWYMHEGDFFMENATTQSSTSQPDSAFFVFDKDGTQTLTLGEGIDFSALPIKVTSGTTLDMGASQIGGGDRFVVEQGAGIMTTLPGGVAGIFLFEEPDVQVTLADSSSYGFNGADAQVTSAMMPDTVQALTIDNPQGVTLSQETLILGELALDAGVFDNTIPFTLGPAASIAYNGGSLEVEVSAAEDVGDGIPRTLFVDQNYPNPFTRSAEIRYGLPEAADVTISVYNLLGQQVRTSAEGHKPAGVHTFELRGQGLSSGMYIYRLEAGDRIVSKRMVVIE